MISPPHLLDPNLAGENNCGEGGGGGERNTKRVGPLTCAFSVCLRKGSPIGVGRNQIRRIGLGSLVRQHRSHCFSFPHSHPSGSLTHQLVCAALSLLFGLLSNPGRSASFPPLQPLATSSDEEAGQGFPQCCLWVVKVTFPAPQSACAICSKSVVLWRSRNDKLISPPKFNKSSGEHWNQL